MENLSLCVRKKDKSYLRRTYDEKDIRKYDVKMKSAPKYKFDDPKVKELIAAGVG